MIQRPKPGESEEDILRMQEEFIREKNKQPSTQIINLRKTEHQTTKRTSPTSHSRKPSKYAQSKGLNSSEKRPRTVEKANVMGEILEKNVLESEEPTGSDTALEDGDDKVYFPQVIPSVLGDIVEKKYNDYNAQELFPMPSTGFPVATKRNSTSIKASDTQHMEIDEPPAVSTSTTTSNVVNELNLPNQSYIVTSKESSDVHNENIKLLSKISEREILEEQQKLLTNLDPKLLEFIRNKRKDNKSEQVKVSEPIKIKEEEKMDTTGSNLNNVNDTLWENDILSHPNVNSWLHFNNLEKDKLEWIKGIEECKKSNPDEPYEARFDFKGYLMPYTMEYTEETKTLFHHGDESHRPGYSLTELFELTRSSVIQQRVVALNTLAGIIEYNSTGIYKDIIDIPLSKIFFIVRIALDENKVVILEPALKAIRNLIFNRIDEASLDALIGFEEGTVQPCLENDKSEIQELESNEAEFKDFHLAEIDIITAMLRTDILQRIYYIIENVRPSFNCVQYSLQILTRLARDSVETANKIVQMDHLISAILNNFIPETSVNFLFESNHVYKGKPILAALKLMRVLSLQSKEIGEVLVNKYEVLKPISAYINSGVDGTYGLRLQIEAFCIITNLLNYDLGIVEAVSLCPVVITTLYKHVQGTDVFISTSVLSVTHAAVVLQYINRLLYCKISNMDNFKENIYPLLKDGLQKWLSQVAHFDSYSCGHLRLVCSMLDCCITVLETENMTFKFLNDILSNLATSNGFQMIIKNLLSSSNLLSKIDDKTDLYSIKNLMCLDTVIIDSPHKILPVLQTKSPVPFLVTLFKLLLLIKDNQITQLYLNQVADYIKEISTKPLYLSSNWFTRMEVELIFSIIRISASNNISESTKDIIYAVANKLCYILRVDKKCELEYLFCNIIFEKQWFTAERLFNLVSLSESDGFSKALTTIEDIKQCYSSVINLRHLHTRNIVLKDWREPILPRDWIYLPILSLYSQSQEIQTTPKVYGKNAEKAAQEIAERKELIIRCSLEWIVFNEMCFPDLLNDIDATDRFCRIMCVFLCDNSLFLDEKIKILLYKCTQILFKNKKHFNFDKELTGLHNFQDLYTQFLEQFQSVSYGDPTFAACVLVPLIQRYNVKWRKLLWSEYAGCLRALDCPERYLCFDLNEYLYPEETDDSLLKSYFRALSSNLLRADTIAYKIANHHIEKYKERKVSEM